MIHCGIGLVRVPGLGKCAPRQLTIDLRLCGESSTGRVNRLCGTDDVHHGADSLLEALRAGCGWRYRKLMLGHVTRRAVFKKPSENVFGVSFKLELERIQ